MMIDIHLYTPAKLIGVEVAGNGNHRRAVEPGIADPRCQVGGAGAEGCDTETRPVGHAAHDIGGKGGGAFMRGQHELDAAGAHRFHDRQDIAARNTKTMGNASLLEGGDDQFGIVHL